MSVAITKIYFGNDEKLTFSGSKAVLATAQQFKSGDKTDLTLKPGEVIELQDNFFQLDESLWLCPVTDKKVLKQLAKSIKNSSTGEAYEYINLKIASLEELTTYVNGYKAWLAKYEVEQKEWEKYETKWKHEEKEQQVQLLEERKQKLAEMSLTFSADLRNAGGKVVEAINLLPEYAAKIWTKNGEMRIYLSNVSYASSKDAGYIKILPSGEVERVFVERYVLDNLRDLLSRLDITITRNNINKQYRSPEEIKEAIKAGQEVSADEVDAALDQMYGKGNWEQWDREDFEG